MIMAGSIRLYGGGKSAMPLLSERMPGFCTDTKELYIGTEGGNTLLASAKAARGEFDAVTIKGYQLGMTGDRLQLKDGSGATRQLAFAAESAPALSEAATTEELIAAYNGLIDRLKACGAMKE